MRALLLLFCISLNLQAASIFVSPFDPIDVSELEEKLTAEKKRGDDADALIPLEFYLAEGYELLHKPHARNQQIQSLLSHCEALKKGDSGLSFGLCAVTRAEQLEKVGLWQLFSKAEEALSAFETFEKSNPDQPTRLYLEARFLSGLPPQFGQDVRKALVNLAVAEKLASRNGQIRFWFARLYERIGNHTKSAEIYEELKRQKDSRYRILDLHENPITRADLSNTDGLGYGFGAGFGYNPAFGFFGRASYSDDRAFDRPLQFRWNLFASSRGGYGMETASYRKKLVSEYSLMLGLSSQRFTEDFYGVGKTAAAITPTEFHGTRYKAIVGVEREFIECIYFGIGWEGTSHAYLDWIDGTTPFKPDTFHSGHSTFHSGPWATLYFDNTDSKVYPLRGGKLKIRGYFPTDGILSHETFEEWITSAEYYHLLAQRHRLSFFGGMAFTRGKVPLSAYPTLSGTYDIVGIRANRERDKSIWATHLEYSFRLGLGWSAQAFFNAINTGTTSGDFFTSSPKLGGGGGLQFGGSRYRNQSLRMDLSVYANEWLFQIGASSRL